MMTEKRIEQIIPGSIADEIGLRAGDYVVNIDGFVPQDILDWQLAESGERLLLTIRHQEGDLVEYEIEKDYDETLGIVFASPTMDEIKSCRNHCLFCFVDQMPKNMRKTLYVKDDDYRLSFLTGSYITLTNLQEEDLARICRLHLSPLYVSVHATDPESRQKLMRNPKAGKLLPLLKRLAACGIQFHTQVVLCPGLNDGAILEQTIADLYALYPSVLTLAVVPVGLTGYRKGLYALQPYTFATARKVLAQVHAWQEKALKEKGTRFVFASDEFYTLAREPLPPAEAYEGYPQLENGVGLVRIMLDAWENWQKRLPQKLAVPTEATVATGVSAAHYLQPIVDRLNEIENLTLKLVPVKNHFFGGQVTVTGLLTYHDLIKALKKVKGTLYLSSVMLKAGKDLFLDGYTIQDLAQALQTRVQVVTDLPDFLEKLLQLK
ncbi:MAG: DUF512 domain-containing protein [Firmicutes bacterium]|nr:DUF512 domain-containing protein [Bacillota bacterium]